MKSNLKKISENYRAQKNTTVIISLIGFSFIVLAVINFSFDIPSEHLIGVSFAAFFFVLADLTLMSGDNEKPKNENFYFLLLLLAVLSFILLPTIIPMLPENKIKLDSFSESLSIASLGIVLIMMNLKLWSAEEEFFDEVLRLNDENMNALDDFETKINSSFEKIDESTNIAENATRLAREATDLSKEVSELNKKLLQLIEEGETLEEIKQEVKKYK